MNPDDPSEPHLSPVGDAELEARIVAWVLGEASAFEAAELARLCEENPELRLFERRIRAVDSLVGGDFSPPEQEMQWRLSQERRAKVTALFDDGGEDEEAAAAVLAERQRRARGYFTRRALLATAACLAVSALGIGYYYNGRNSGRGDVAMRERLSVEQEQTLADEQQDIEAGLAQAVRDQEAKVEDKRRALETIVRTENIIYNSASGSGGDNPSDESNMAAKAYIEAESNRIALESQIETLLKYDGDQLNSYAAGLDMPDNLVKHLYPDYLEAKRKLERLRQDEGLGDSHPAVVAERRVVAGMQQDLDHAVGSLRGVLTTKLELSKETLRRLSERRNSAKSETVKQSIETANFDDAKEDFEQAQRLLANLKMKQITEGIEHKVVQLPGVPRVAIAASPAPVPQAALAKNASPPSPAKPESALALGGRAQQEKPGAAPEGAVDSLAELKAPTEEKSVLAARDDRAKASLSEAPAAPPSASLASRELRDSSEHRFPAGPGAEADFSRGAQDSKSTLGDNEADSQALAESGKMGRSSGLGLAHGGGGGTPAQSQGVPNGWWKETGADPGYANSPDRDDDVDGFSNREEFESMKETGLARFRSEGKAGADFVNPVNGSLGSGAADAPDVSTAGLRGGSGAISRNNIDAVLNNPDRAGAAGEVRDIGRLFGADAVAGRVRIDGDTKSKGKAADKDLSAAQASNSGIIRRELYTAEGAYNLGKFDEAKKQYQEVLKTDPLNAAARRGIEQVAQARAEYYRAAYDDTRSGSLAEVDAAWGLMKDHPFGSGKDVSSADPAALSGGDVGFGYVMGARTDGAPQLSADYSTGVATSRRLGDFDGWVPLPGSEPVLSAPLAQGGPKNNPGRMYEFRVKDAEAPEVQQSLNLFDHFAAQDAFFGDNADSSLALPSLAKPADVPPPPSEPPSPSPPPENEKAEIAAAENAFSTFSLHVSDSSFRLAKAALDRGEQPAPASIREEEFYNAVDYGDAPAARDEPVACVVEQSAHPVRPQRDLVRIGIRTGSSGRSAATPLNLVLLLDSSGSMEREDRHASLLQAVRDLSTLLKEGDTVTLVGFSRKPRLLADRLPGSQASRLPEIVAGSPVEGGTDLAQGLDLAADLAARQFNPKAQNRIVLFTDGAANLGDADPASLADKIAKLRERHIAFDAAGFGAAGLNDQLLERLTRHGDGRYYVVDRPEDAGPGFAKRLAGAFRPAAENVKVQVQFNPSRVSHYRLRGFAEHRLNKEDFHNDSVDAAEMAAEEAGNALYEVETLPQGEGEIGEISVRFRNAATGEMVERTWTIPYESQSLAFDKATSSMQLAGLSLLAAEKLEGGSGAAQIDFNALQGPIANVRQTYGQQPAASQLLEMLGKLR